MPHLALHSPVGDLTLFADDAALIAVEWGWADGGAPTPLLSQAKAELDAYFDRRLRAFSVPLNPVGGTAFRQRVWTAMRTIPWGETRSYGDLSRLLGTAARPVGTACGRNPLPIFIPCHRVLGANGALGGFSGGDGLPTKCYLLRLEGATGIALS